ncbi:hypothetical protein VF21_05284 [Pseudogymnoascus sp. 05NY08]|nr:hypothetical protein VF21_05284 [Pseudogymnoascus sp. 05NY08]
MKSDNLAIARFNSSSPSSTRTTSDVALQTLEESEAARLYDYHLSLLRPGHTQQSLQEVTTAPICTMPVLKHAKAIVDGKYLLEFPQYGLLAGLADAILASSLMSQLRRARSFAALKVLERAILSRAC